jgi:hypothetical protein
MPYYVSPHYIEATNASGTESGFLRVLRLPLPILTAPNVPLPLITLSSHYTASIQKASLNNHLKVKTIEYKVGKHVSTFNKAASHEGVWMSEGTAPLTYQARN